MKSDPEVKQEEFQFIDSEAMPKPISKYIIDSLRFDNIPDKKIYSFSNVKTTIPTRFFEKQLLKTAKDVNPYKFNVNYSAAGQKLAKKAQEQLKTVKEIEKIKIEENDIIMSYQKSIYNNDESLNDDWRIVSEDFLNFS